MRLSQCEPVQMEAILIYVYGDESMDESFQRVCSVGGLVGSQSQWETIERKWILRTGGLEFHANDCDSDQGAYMGKDHHKENKSLYKDLTTMLAESGLQGFAVAIDILGMNEVFPSPTLHERMYFRGFIDVIEAMQNHASSVGEMAEVTFDTRPQSDHNAATLYGQMRETNIGWKESLAPKISFQCSTDPRIQMADLFAREAMKDLDNKTGPVKRGTRRSWAALKDTGRFNSHVLGKDHFQELHDEFYRPGTDYREGPVEYDTWLKAKHRQHNDTNFLVFLNERWRAKNPS